MESAPAAADTSAAAFVPAQLDLTPTSGTLVAGTARTFRARVLNAAGVSVVLETPLVVPLIRGSAGGEFRAVGTTTAITSITIPAGASEGSFDYYDTVAGVATVTVTSSRTTPDSSIVTVSPAGVAAIALSPAAAGLAVGSSIVLTAVATDAYGNVVPGAPITWAVEGPATLSDTSGAYVTVTVTGPGIMRVTATTGTHFVTSRITGFGPSGDGGASGNIAIGLGGGIALGIVVGVAVGWFLFRRRKGGEPFPPPPGDSK